MDTAVNAVAPTREKGKGGATPDDIARLPILIGFTGRRSYGEDAAENDRLIRIAAERFRRFAEWLDEKLPLTPKVLLCGGDAGTDLAIVSTVLEGATDEPSHPLWSVVVVRAFDNYVPDAESAAAYRELELVHPSRIAFRTLRHLLSLKVDHLHPEEDELARERPPAAEAPKEEHDRFRSEHFEQHALWLARYATLLVAASAVGTAELAAASAGEATDRAAAKPGATSRVVAYRRAAVPDAFAAATIERSHELLVGSSLDEPDGEHVLWIDPTTADNWPADLPPLQVLRPIQEIFDQRQAAPSLAEARDAIYEEPFKPFAPLSVGGYQMPDDPWSALEGALVVASKFEALCRRQIPLYRRPFVTRNGAKRAAPFSNEPPHKFLARVRDRRAPIGTQQLFAHAIVRWSLRTLIGVFLLAVLLYEAYLELQPHQELWLFLYVMVLAAIAGIVLWVNRIDVARRTEDLRGLREVLRVQVAWWASGLELMVDRVHLRRIDSDLKIIREVAATVSMWAMLRTSERVPVANRDFAEASDWIDEQVTYHRRRWESNEGFKRLSQQGATIGLLAAWLSLAALWVIRFFVLPYFEKSATSKLEPSLVTDLRPWVFFAIAIWIACAVTVAADFIRQFSNARLFRWPRNRWEYVTAASAVATAAALLAVAAFGDMLTSVLAGLAGLLVATLAACWATRMEWVTGKWRVPRISELQKFRCAATTAGFLIGFTGILAPAIPTIGSTPAERPTTASALPSAPGTESAPAATPTTTSAPPATPATASAPPTASESPAPTKGSAQETNPDVYFAFRALVLTATTLVLAASGMLRYYVDRRNHAAQAAQSDDCLRAFLRAQAILKSAQKALASRGDDEGALRQARRSIIEIGMLALDENEAWLRAHRERPVEAVR